MKEIEQFFESLRNLYKRILSGNPERPTTNFIKTSATTKVPFSHYRFYLVNEEIDTELVSLLVAEQLCNGEILSKDARSFVVIPELALQQYKEDTASKILTKFEDRINNLLLPWPSEKKLQLAKITDEVNNSGVVRFSVSYGTFPPEISVTSDTNILRAIQAFLISNNIISIQSKQNNVVSTDKRTFTLGSAQQGIDLLPKIIHFVRAFTTTEDIPKMKDTLVRYEQQQAKIRLLLQTMSHQNADPVDIVNRVSECLGVPVKDQSSSGFKPGFLTKRSLKKSEDNIAIKRHRQGDKGLEVAPESFSLKRSM